MGRWADKAALGLTLAALVGATIWFGATSQAFLAAVEIVIYASALILLLSRRDIFTARCRTPLDLPVAALVAIPLLQLIPIPSPLNRALSPGLSRLRDSLGLDWPALLPLSAYPYVTALALRRIAAAALVFFIISRTLLRPEQLRTALLALVWLGTAEAAFGLLGFLLDSPTILAGQPQYYRGSVTGTLICKNHFAGLMEMSIPAAAAYYFLFTAKRNLEDPKERTARLTLALGALLLMSLALAFSGSRAGIVCFAFSVAVAFTLARRGPRRAYDRIALAALAAAFLIYGNAIGFDPVIERFQALTADHAMDRVEIWRDGLRLALLSPTLGTGAGTWASLFPAIKSTPVQLTFSHAHNDYVQTLTEGGVLGLGVFLWLLVAAFRLVRSTLDNLPDTSRRRLALLALAAAILSISLHGLVDFNLQIPSNLFLFMTLLGVLAAVSRGPIHDPFPWEPSRGEQGALGRQKQPWVTRR